MVSANDANAPMSFFGTLTNHLENLSMPSVKE